MKNFKKIVAGILVIALVAAVIATVINIVLSKTDKKHNPVVTMEIEGYGNVKLELDPEAAPNTVKNFIRLAQRGYYNGKTFSDVQEGLVVGGLDDVSGDEKKEMVSPKLSNIKDLAEGEEDKEYTIPGEFIEKGHKNMLSHQRGVISMTRTTYNDFQQEIAMIQMIGYGDYINGVVDKMYDSQAAGFFILTEDEIGYDGTYSAFGRVVDGMDIIDRISKLELEKSTDSEGKETAGTGIVNAPVIKNVTVDTYGVDYGVPETEDAYDFEAIFNFLIQNYMQSQNSTTDTSGNTTNQ